MNTLLKIFSYWLLGVIALVVLFSFFGPKTKSIDLKRVDFNTTSSSALYFKNLRSFYYHIEEDSSSRYHIYKLKRLEELNNGISLSIIHNWLLSESYIIFDWDTVAFKSGLKLFYKEDEFVEEISLDDLDSYSQYVFAAKLYEFITSDGELYFQGNKEKINPSLKKALKTSLKDYFKLVGKLH
jgi:hypothetical protein